LNFTGSDGVTSARDLNGNADVRDFNNGIYTNPINGAMTTNFFNTPTSRTGGAGRLDMQDIVLRHAFATRTLTSIQPVDTGHAVFRRTAPNGVTVATTPAPEPASLISFGTESLFGLIGRHVKPRVVRVA
jgi:hypothetical protein